MLLLSVIPVPDEDTGVVDLLSLENILSGLQEVDGIVGPIIDPDLIMQMRSRTPAGASKQADLVPVADSVAHLDLDLFQMPIPGADPETMVDFDHPAIVPHPPRIYHFTRRRC